MRRREQAGLLGGRNRVTGLRVRRGRPVMGRGSSRRKTYGCKHKRISKDITSQKVEVRWMVSVETGRESQYLKPWVFGA